MSINKNTGVRSREDLMDILKEAGVISDAHYILTSGNHATQSIQCARLFENPKLTAKICEHLAGPFMDAGIDVVLGPAMGGIVPAYEIARILGARNIFCERENGSMKLRRGYFVNPGEKILIAEDVITTGGSVRMTLSLIEDAGGVAAGVCAIADLSAGRARFTIPSVTAAVIDLPSYTPEECPLCKAGVALEHRASRAI